ncbi:Methylthioribose-1-phosphate isomerase [Leucoagaricus sp. SymC.cos]|nr:Methylthioribose-1-phosphate isomerase [Leucoagaricus sp. SymC.cos]
MAAAPELTSIKVDNDKIEIVNQLLLPHVTKYVQINSVEDAYDSIKTMKAKFLSSHTAFQTHIETILGYLYKSRPTAVNLGAATRRLTKTLHDSIAAGREVSTIAEDLIQEGRLVADEDVGRNKAMAKWGGEWLIERVKTNGESGEGLNVLTVCNTGSLATSGYGTAFGLIMYLHETGKLGKAHFTQTAPYHQGSRLTAYEFKTLKIPSVMICDTMVGSLFQHHKIHAVAVGADRIARNGDTANKVGLDESPRRKDDLFNLRTKIGTYNAAVLAARHNIPFIVVAPISTVDLDVSDGSKIPIEHRPPLEACLVRGILYPNDGKVEQVQVMITPTGLDGIYNPSFDVTPAELITAIVTEKGVAIKAEGAKEFDLSPIV